MTISCLRFACWITKPINTHSEYVILIGFLGNSGYANAPLYYVIHVFGFFFIYIQILQEDRRMTWNVRKTCVGVQCVDIPTRKLIHASYFDSELTNCQQLGCASSDVHLATETRVCAVLFCTVPVTEYVRVSFLRGEAIARRRRLHFHLVSRPKIEASVVQRQRAGLWYPISRVQTRPKPSDF